MAYGIRDNRMVQLDSDDEADVEFISPNQWFGSHINLIPIQNAVQGPRLFYGARFYNQAMPLESREAPLVQTLVDNDPQGRSFDDLYGKYGGAVRADDDDDEGGEVVEVTDDAIRWRNARGEVKSRDLYRHFPFNRKSVTGDTEILFRRDGVVFSTRIDAYAFREGDEVSSYDPETKLSAWRQVRSLLTHVNDKRLFRIQFESGRSVTVTEDHSLLTLDAQWGLSAILPDECVVNATKCPVVFAPLQVDDGEEHDFKFGVLAGLYLAEGSVGPQPGFIRIAIQPRDRIDQTRELVSELGFTPHRSAVGVHFTSHEFAAELVRLYGKGASLKYIHHEVFNRPRRFLEGLIAGYMSGDGNLWCDSNGAVQVTGVSTSRTLRDNLVCLLGLLGIFVTKFDVPRKHINPKWKDAYGFRVISTHLSRLSRWFFYEARQAKLNSLQSSTYRASPFEHLPFPRQSRRMVYAALAGEVPHFVYKSANQGYVSKRRLIKASGVVGCWAKSDIMWDTIVDIIPAEHEHIVYDLEVEGSETFALTDGLMVHNSGVHHKSLVKPGDRLTKGQVLAASNFTDDKGTLALGVNARVGLLPYRGFSMDDAIVVSEGFAKRMASQHVKVIDQDFDNDIRGGKDHYRSLFQTKFTKDQLEHLDDDGVVLPGTTLQPGDPIVLATRPKSISSTTAQLGKLSKVMRQARGDAAQIWEGTTPAVVTDVAKTSKGVKVVLGATVPLTKGDKMVFRSGQKSYHPDTEVLTENGWKHIQDLLAVDRVAALFDAAEVSTPVGRKSRPVQHFVARFVTPYHANTYHFEGELFGLDAVRAAYLTTGNHRIWRAGHMGTSPRWYCQDAREVEGTPQKFMLAAPFDLSDRDKNDPEWVTIPDAIHGVTGKPMGCVVKFPFRAWVQFMALYLAEGNIQHSNPNDHVIVITQKERPFCRTLEQVLDQMGLSWQVVGNQYVTNPNKALRLYLEQFGKAPDKFVPLSIKQASLTTIQLFLDTIWQCDGDKAHGKHYYTSSKALASDIQELVLLTGRAATVNWRPARAHQNYDSADVTVLDITTTSTKKNYNDAYYRETYKGPVYCLQVAGLGVILTRFRGKVMWNGNSIVSRILPDDHMPRSKDGKPLEVLLNPLGIPSRVNDSLVYELLLGKAAAARGTPYKLPSFNGAQERWYDLVEKELQTNGLSAEEELFDPLTGRAIENPVTTGVGHIMKLHHVAADKAAARGTGTYDVSQQPIKGGDEGAKRLSGLETHGLLSAGAYATLRESATLRGQRNDEFWRQLRAGATPKPPGRPFVWDKFRVLLQGAGLQTRDLGDGRLRMGAFTDADLDRLQPIEVKKGELVDMKTLEPVEGGLFDVSLVGTNKWGYIRLPQPLLNPAFEEPVRHLLGLKRKELQDIMAGRAELPEHLR